MLFHASRAYVKLSGIVTPAAALCHHFGRPQVAKVDKAQEPSCET